jgi:hypothetical protein
MDKLHWVTSTLGIVLALGLTRLLASGVTLFRARGQAAFDWVPIVWAVCIFMMLLQFSWALLYLGSVDRDWTFVRFLVPLAEVTLLFVAAALILPTELKPGDDLRALFERDGRWAIAVIAAYKAIAIGLNWWTFNAWPLSNDRIINAVLVVSAVAFVLVRRRWMEWAATTVFAVVLFGTSFLIG